MMISGFVERNKIAWCYLRLTAGAEFMKMESYIVGVKWSKWCLESPGDLRRGNNFIIQLESLCHVQHEFGFLHKFRIWNQ